MSAELIAIAADMAILERLGREDALNHIEARLTLEPCNTVRRALKRAYHTIFERKETSK